MKKRTKNFDVIEIFYSSIGSYNYPYIQLKCF